MLLSMKIEEAYEKCQSRALADEIWAYKHPREDVDDADKEYISWRNSLPIFLECAFNAGLNKVITVFEMKTPISNKSMDVLLIGKSPQGENRILIVELKQWTRISTMYVKNPDKVWEPYVREVRRHPMYQLKQYMDNLNTHHSGIQAARNNGIDFKIGKIAYLHNFEDKESLYRGPYSKWDSEKISIYGRGNDEKERLTRVLRNCFNNSTEEELLEILEDYDAVMGDEGLAGLRLAYENEASLNMQNDQQAIVDFVVRHLQAQKNNPRPEIIVVSGGPGTGKTIVGIRFILEYVNIFNNGRNDNRVIFCLPKSKTVKAMIDEACTDYEDSEREYCSYLDEISGDQNLVVVDEYDIIGLSREAA